jgi:hypothetical protein
LSFRGKSKKEMMAKIDETFNTIIQLIAAFKKCYGLIASKLIFVAFLDSDKAI